MEDVSTIHNREKHMLDLHPFGERNIRTWCDMGSVRIVNRKIAALAQHFQTFFNVPLDNFYSRTMITTIEEVCNREPLTCRFCRGTCQRYGHVVLL